MLDICIIVTLALCASAGWRRGLVRTVYRLVAVFLSLFLARLLFPYMAEIIGGFAPLRTAVYDGFYGKIGADMAAVGSDAAAGVGGAVTAAGLPTFVADIISVAALKAGAAVGESMAGYAADALTGLVINALSWLAVFAVASVVVNVVGGALNVVAHLPVINTLNRAGGLAVGLLLGIAATWVVIAAFVLIYGAAGGAVLESSRLVGVIPGGKHIVELLCNIKNIY